MGRILPAALLLVLLQTDPAAAGASYGSIPYSAKTDQGLGPYRRVGNSWYPRRFYVPPAGRSYGAWGYVLPAGWGGGYGRHHFPGYPHHPSPPPVWDPAPPHHFKAGHHAPLFPGHCPGYGSFGWYGAYGAYGGYGGYGGYPAYYGRFPGSGYRYLLPGRGGYGLDDLFGPSRMYVTHVTGPDGRRTTQVDFLPRGPLYLNGRGERFVAGTTATPPTLVDASALDPREIEYIQLGDQYFRNGDFPRAASAYATASRINQQSPFAYLALAHALLGEGRFTLAAASLARGVRLYPDWGRQNLDLNQVFDDADFLARRLAQLRAQLAEEPGDTQLQLLLGYVLLFSGEAEAGRELLGGIPPHGDIGQAAAILARP